MNHHEMDAAERRIRQIGEECETNLVLQRIAMGDDSHYFKASLVKFVVDVAKVREVVAEQMVNEYLLTQADFKPSDAFRLKVRRTLFGPVRRSASPEQIAAAWKCFVIGLGVKK